MADAEGVGNEGIGDGDLAGQVDGGDAQGGEAIDPGIADILSDFGMGDEGDASGDEAGDGKAEGEEGDGAAAVSPGDAGDGEGAEGADAEGDAGEEGKDEKDILIAQLQAQINELSKGAVQAPAAAATDGSTFGASNTADFVGEYFPDEASYNKALDDPKEMNKVLSKVATDAAAKAREDTMRTIPAIITPLVQTTIAVNMAAAQFYRDNPDLGDKKEFVGFVTNDLIGKNPDWKLDKVMTELGKEVRTRLGLKQKAEGVDRKAAAARPAFVKKGGGGRGAAQPSTPQLSGLEAEIMDLIP